MPSTVGETTMNVTVNQRGPLTPAQMDAIGRFDEMSQAEGPDVETGTTPLTRSSVTDETRNNSSPTLMTAMEIAEADELIEDTDIDEDLERLLGDSAAVLQKKQKTNRKRGCCYCKTRLIGNQTIVCSDYFDKTGWGVVGPQWYGPGCVLALVAGASHHFIKKALEIGPMTVAVCVLFALVTTYNLIDTAFRNPGICLDKIRPENVANVADYVWCDFCSVFQPPDGAHCPDCNVCVAGYDHHCVWMGTCIGKKNFKQFVRFNLSWLGYLLYAVLWVTVVAPALYHLEKE